LRIRQIKPAYWLDKDLRRGLNADQREFYIGLWMLADDAGWLDWDCETVAAELYPYTSVRKREVNVVAWAERLETLVPASPHLIRYGCGHARIPKLPDHQRFGGRPVFTCRDAHARDCARPIADARPGRVGNGTESNGGVRGGFESTTTEEDDRRQQLSEDFKAGRITELEYRRLRAAS
jgi:hypothetical protein